MPALVPIARSWWPRLVGGIIGIAGLLAIVITGLFGSPKPELNPAEYLTWIDPRLRSYDQYLWADAPGGAFATGLVTSAGVPKPGFYAFRMPRCEKDRVQPAHRVAH